MIREIFAENGVAIDPTQAEKLDAFRALLVEYNERFNLTAITDEKEVVVKHFLDSALGLPFLPERGEVVDVGSGAGFPSVPLLILTEGRDVRFTLVDSLQKRVGFLREVLERLALTNGTAIHARAEEEAARRREFYDAAVARAVAPMNVLVEYTLPLVKKGGRVIAYKGQSAEEELAAAKRGLEILGGEARIEKRVLNGEYERDFVIVEKVRNTPQKYPRGQNKPRSMPL